MSQKEIDLILCLCIAPAHAETSANEFSLERSQRIDEVMFSVKDHQSPDENESCLSNFGHI